MDIELNTLNLEFSGSMGAGGVDGGCMGAGDI